jgi:hypothetical protein
MLSPPPGRFSTTKGWPSDFCNSSASARVKTSPPPPGPSGMMMRTGRAGHSCAAAGTSAEKAPIAPQAISRIMSRRIVSSQDFCRDFCGHHSPTRRRREMGMPPTALAIAPASISAL